MLCINISSTAALNLALRFLSSKHENSICLAPLLTTLVKIFGKPVEGMSSFNARRTTPDEALYWKSVVQRILLVSRSLQSVWCESDLPIGILYFCLSSSVKVAKSVTFSCQVSLATSSKGSFSALIAYT